MSAWAEIVNADGSDEWLEKCSAALVEVQRETLHRAAAKIRADYRLLCSEDDGLAGVDAAADHIDREVST